MNEETRRKKIQRAIDEFQKWSKEKYDIYDDQGSQKLILKEDEVFVRLYDYINFRFHDYYYISNYGNIISFAYRGTTSPILLKPSAATDGYLKITIRIDNSDKTSSLKVHMVVWYSFMIDSIVNHISYPELHQIGFNFDEVSFDDFENFLKTHKETAEVHHETLNVQHNYLRDLELLSKFFHKDILHPLANTNNEQIRFEKTIAMSEEIVNHTPNDKISVIIADKENKMVSIDQPVMNETFKAELTQEIEHLDDPNYQSLKVIVKRIIIHALSISPTFFDDFKLIKIHDNGRTPSDTFIRIKEEQNGVYQVNESQPTLIETYDIVLDYSKRTLEYPKNNLVIPL